MNTKKIEKTLITSITSILILVLIIGISYAYIRKDTKQQSTNVVQTNCINVELEDVTNAITLKNAYPMEDSKGETTEPYTFKLTNTCNVGVDYNIDLEIIQEANAMSATNIATKIDENDKVVLTNDRKTIVEGETGDIYKIGQGTLEPHTSVEHSLRLWLDINAGNDAQNKTFKSKIIIDALQNQVAIYTEQILNGADPVLDEEGKLVPVKINLENGTVTKAKVTEEWYNYKNKEWANAVILKEGVETPEDNVEIKEDDIESYFVWIPKYSYKLFDMGEYQSAVATLTDKGPTTAIEIEFGLVNTTNDESNEKHKECATPMLANNVQGASGKSGECNEGEWMTHPAFIAFDTKGLWVGKFETSDAGGSKVQIKPNVASWREQSLGNSYTISFEYNRNLDSHNMKNTEWGAVAYLTQSIYGRCTSSNECTEVGINTNTSYRTGYLNTNYVFPNSNSGDASTTKNVTGIYDLRGGSWDQMASIMASSVGGTTPSYASSELNGKLTDPKYYDLYDYGADQAHFNRRILGDATGEMGPFVSSASDYYVGSFYGDWARFAGGGYPCFSRGGGISENTLAGLFTFAHWVGNANSLNGFRIVLAPKE